MAITLNRQSCPHCLSDDNVCEFVADKGPRKGQRILRCKTPDCEFNNEERNVGQEILNGVKEMKKDIKNQDFIAGEYHSLEKTRGLTEQTVKFCDIQVAKYKDRWVTVFNYRDVNEQLVKQKVKFKIEEGAKKEMFFKGNGSDRGLYLQNKWKPNPKLFITVTEGEEDAAAVAQSQDLQYPVVSVSKGADDAVETIKENLKYLLGFKYVVLAFDNDDAGRKATEQCLKLFDPDKVRVAEWKLKDANDVLRELGAEEVRKTIFFAREFVPDSIVTMKDIVEAGIEKTKYGPLYPWKFWNEATWGLQTGIQIIIGASGVGKTTLLSSIIFNFIDQGINVFYMNFEHRPPESMKRIVGCKLGVDLTDPNSPWDQELINKTTMEFNDKLALYDKAGGANTKDIFSAIRYQVKAKKVKLVILDNLSALGIALDNKAALETMNTLESLMKELDCTIILLSHTAQDKFKISTHIGSKKDEESAYDTNKRMHKPGLDWATGRMPTVPEGHNSIKAKADFIIGLARNQFAETEEERNTLIAKVIKSRYNSKLVGKECRLLQKNQTEIVEIDDFNNERLL